MVAALGEKQIKRLLTQHLRAAEEGTRARLLSELCVAQFARRADVVLVNGHLSAFEIKGERDKLDRLPGQIATYLQHFERVTVVCAARHTAAVLKIAAESVGVWEARETGFETLREAAPCAPLSLEAWLSYLPVKVLTELLTKFGVKPSGRRREHLLDAAVALPIAEVRNAALRYLKSPQRASRIRQAKAARRVAADPVELHRLRVQEYLRLAAAAGGAMTAIPRLKTTR
ncbi:sce7726 family protein [Achromobacter sp. HNDS-1]|uniref:Sce7726 family protein n=1 Tax=Achromobacter sp. HNDS-1 TaxID=3151598 RepID=A0AAU7LDS9_9BURK